MIGKATIPLFLIAVAVFLFLAPDMAFATMPERSGSDMGEFFFTVLDSMSAPTVMIFAYLLYVASKLCRMHRKHAEEVELLNASPGEFTSQSWKKRKVGVGKALGKAFVEYLILLAIFGICLFVGTAITDTFFPDLSFSTSNTLRYLFFMIFFAYPFFAAAELAFAKFENDWYKKLVAIFGNKWQRAELAQY